MFEIVQDVYSWTKFAFRLTIRNDDLPQILITLLSSTLGIYILLGLGSLYLFRSQKNWITRRIHAVSWIGCFLVSVSTLIFLILGYKGIAGGLTFYTWVSHTFQSSFDFRYIYTTCR